MNARTMIRASAMAFVVALAAAQPAHAALTLLAAGGGAEAPGFFAAPEA
jgi:hypothetical protein